MAINRYYLPAQQEVANTYVPLPYNEILQAAQAQEQYLDDIEAQRLELAGKEFSFLKPDRPKAQAAQEWLDTEAEKIAGLYSTDLRQAKSAMQKFQNEAKKRFGKFGDIGAMEGNYNAYVNYANELQEQVKRKELDPYTMDALLAEANKAYLGIGEYDPAKGYNTFSGQTAALKQDLPKWVKDNLSDLEAITNSTASARPDGKGYIFTDKFTGEEVSPERVMAAFTQLAQSDESLMNWVAEGERLGLNRLEALGFAGDAGVTKYAYYRHDVDKDIKSDDTPFKQKEWGMDKRSVLEGVTHLAPEEGYNIEQNMTGRQEALKMLDEEIARSEAQLEQYKDENGNILEAYKLNYASDLKDLQSLQQEKANLETKQKLDQDIFVNTFMDVFGEGVQEFHPNFDPNRSEIIDVAFDPTNPAGGGSIIYYDKNHVLEYKDANGEKVYIPEDVDEEVYAKENNLTPKYAVKTISYNTPQFSTAYGDYKPKLQEFKTKLEANASKSKDMTLIAYTAADFKASPELKTIQETIFNNPTFFTVLAIDEKGNYADTGETLADYYDEYSTTGPDPTLPSYGGVAMTQSGKSNLQANSKLVSSVGDDANSQLIELPDGKRVIVTPKGSTLPSYSAAVKQNALNLYNATQAPQWEYTIYRQEFPEVASRAKDFKKQVGTATAYKKGEEINTDPIPLPNGYYLHSNVIDKQGKTNIWISKDKNDKKVPPSGYAFEEIPLGQFENYALKAAYEAAFE